MTFAERKRLRAAAASNVDAHAVERVAFSPAEWRSFQRMQQARRGAAASTASFSSMSSDGGSCDTVAADLCTALAKWSHDSHAVFSVVALGNNKLFVTGASRGLSVISC